MKYSLEDKINSFPVRVGIAIIIWCLLAYGFHYFLGNLNLPRFETLSKRGMETKGKVLEKFPNNHATVKYSFSIKGRDYVETGHVGYGNPRFENLSLGQVVTVFYDPLDPTNSTLGDPEKERQNESLTMNMVTFLMPTFVMFALFRKGFFDPYNGLH